MEHRLLSRPQNMRNICHHHGQIQYWPQQSWGIKDRRHGYGDWLEILLLLFHLMAKQRRQRGHLKHHSQQHRAHHTWQTIRCRLGVAGSTNTHWVILPPVLEESVFSCSLYPFASFHSIINHWCSAQSTLSDHTPASSLTMWRTSCMHSSYSRVFSAPFWSSAFHDYSTDDILEHWKQHYMKFPLVGNVGFFAEWVERWKFSGNGRPCGMILLPLPLHPWSIVHCHWRHSIMGCMAGSIQ